MALPSTVHWDVRTTGDDTNGGGFNYGATGTDYSQQNAAQVTYTDLVIGAGGNTLTSAANPFTAAHVGNIINITGGTGFTTGRYCINSVAGSTATIDRSAGTVSSTGGAGKLGGSLATIALAVSWLVSKNWIFIKAGTYTFTSKIQINIQQVQFVGYETTHGDFTGVRPLITTATNATILFEITHGSDPKFIFSNMLFTNSAATREAGIANLNGNNSLSLTVLNCGFTGCNYGIAASSGIAGNSPRVTHAINSYFANCIQAGAAIGGYGDSSGGPTIIQDCNFIGNGADGIRLSGSHKQVIVRGCLVVANTGYGIKVDNDHSAWIINCTIAKNTLSGIYFGYQTYYEYPLAAFLENNILYGNSRYGVEASNISPSWAPGVGNRFVRANAFGLNTLGNYGGFFPSDPTDIALTVSPFTNYAGNDYTLNSTAGGGALCRGTGHPNPFPGT